jgi:hypothetical protein
MIKYQISRAEAFIIVFAKTPKTPQKSALKNQKRSGVHGPKEKLDLIDQMLI